MKRFLALLLSFILVISMVACGDKDVTGETGEVAEATPTEVPEPENLAEAKMSKLIKSMESGEVSESLSKLEDGVGYDITLRVSADDELAENLSLGDLQKLTMNIEADIKDNTAMSIDVKANKDKIVTADIILTEDTFYYNLPEYANVVAEAPFEEVFGMSLEDMMASSTEESFDIDEFKDVFVEMKELSINLLKCFKPTDGIKGKAKLSAEGYKVTGTKYTLKADSLELADIIEDMSDAFSVIGELDVEDLIDAMTETENTYLSYYVGEGGAYAWELTIDEEADEPLGFISTDDGCILYAVMEEDEDPQVFFYTEKEGDTHHVYLTDDTTGEITEFDFTKDGDVYTIEGEDETAEYSATIEFGKDDELIVEFSLDTESAVVDLSLESTKDSTEVAIGFKVPDTGALKVDISCTEREYKRVKTPKNAVPMDEWTEEVDMEAFMEDMGELVEKYPILGMVFDFTESGDDSDFSDNYYDEDDYDYTYNTSSDVDWDCFRFEVSGKTFELPCDVSDVMAVTKSQVDSDYANQTMKPQSYYTSMYFENESGGRTFAADLVNYDTTSQPIENGVMFGIRQTDYFVTDNNAPVVKFPGDLTVGMRITYDELVAMFGEAQDVYEYEGSGDFWSNTYTWMLDEDVFYRNCFVVSITKGYIDEISLTKHYE